MTASAFFLELPLSSLMNIVVIIDEYGPYLASLSLVGSRYLHIEVCWFLDKSCSFHLCTSHHLKEDSFLYHFLSPFTFKFCIDECAMCIMHSLKQSLFNIVSL